MSDSTQRLVYMANQIALNFAVRGEAAAVTATADHLQQFWDPGMKAKIFKYLGASGAGLSATAAAAIRSLPGWVGTGTR
jgi:formate dehydrogenase subunit delta